ncbi:SCO2322 family protein [Streptomyces catenulae]|uniref:SCO2322 family protein n=1 Tax=Streptomyces catenulae TaxID=66875 RepID=A0ABV2YXJ7_9ACTN|nr:SCO2322 family protein [Streptomyces catenulae]
MRRSRWAGALALAGAALVPVAGPAHAQGQAYRYWSFWDGADGKWAYATQGPATLRPADGAVTGFRFTVSAESSAVDRPSAAADFGKLCSGTPRKSGTKRVGVVVDFGTAADAPDGERPPKERAACARVPEDASAGEALAAVAKPLRYDAQGLLCGVAGYPRSGCAEQVGGAGTAKPKASASGEPAAGADGDGGPSAGLIGGGAAVVVLGAAAVWQTRRRRG